MIRDYISVDWEVSPRIITVADSETAVSIQDLYDTLRSLESASSGIDNDAIVAGAGKEPLGSGVLVGLTITLLNAKLAFEARPPSTFVQCNISGGNLVAVDENGAEMDAIQTTAYTQVVKTSSSSATLTEQATVQYASFGNAVNIDEENTTGRAIAGVGYPAGTLDHPADNLSDAIVIRAERGFGLMRIFGSLNIDSEIAWDVGGMIFEGLHPRVSSVAINTESLTQNCIFRNLTVTGVLDGNNVLEDCIIPALVYVEGECHRCELTGTIVLGGSTGVHLRQCFSGALSLAEVAEVDMAGSGRNLAVHDWSGHLTLSNLTGDSVAVISAGAGAVITISETCTAGTVIVCGVGIKIVDERTEQSTCQIFDTYNVTPAAAWNTPIEGTLTGQALLRLFAAVLAGKSSGSPGSTITFRDVDDSKNRVVATVDTDGNRLALTLDASD